MRTKFQIIKKLKFMKLTQYFKSMLDHQLKKNNFIKMFSIRSHFLHLTHIHFDRIDDRFIIVFAIKFECDNFSHDFDEKKKGIIAI